jgi:hypothetical protein
MARGSEKEGNVIKQIAVALEIGRARPPEERLLAIASTRWNISCRGQNNLPSLHGMLNMNLPAPILVLLVSLTSVAYSEQYDCTYKRGSSVVKGCPVDSADKNRQQCDFVFSGDVTLSCFASQLSKQNDILGCGFYNPLKAVSELVQDLTKLALPEITAALTTSPGFNAGAVVITQDKSGNISVGFQEKTGSPTLIAVCKVH